MIYHVGKIDYLGVSDVARQLGVSVGSVRTYTDKGSIKAIRHPLNGWRLYTQSAITKALNKIKPPKKKTN